MNTVKLSSQGQVIIPESLRAAHHWEAGQELIAVDTGDGVLFKPKTPFEETSIKDVASCLMFKGEAKTLQDMEAAIAEGVKAKYR